MYLTWCNMGRPRNGLIAYEKNRSRARFKQALKHCKRMEHQIIADKLADKCLKHDDNGFWKDISRVNKTNVSLSTKIENVTGERNIAELWRKHYSDIFNAVRNSASDYTDLHCDNDFEFTESDISGAISDLRRGKSPGNDGMSAEHLMHASHTLFPMLTKLFTSCVTHGYLPEKLLDVVVVPIVKNRCGNVSDKSNYRPIALSNVLSKLFEKLLLKKIDGSLSTSDNQFRF